MPERASPPQHHTDRGIVRRRVFLETAVNVFCERGYAGVNVNAIVNEAGGSLATLYTQFGSKEGLFLAVLEECNARFASALCPVVDHSLGLGDGLRRIGEHYLRQALTIQSRRFFRMICAASAEFPEAAKECLRIGPNRVAETVAEYLRARAGIERVAFSDADAAALAFFALVRGPHQYRAILDDGYDLSDAEVALHVRAAVSLLLNGAVTRG
ncbi:MAG: TetR/AcrR family transcriptional regulator [Hyphomonadaceae bacterium]|nr:TetR/AcrR family transcriptional regulator [Hyphomonadaceae bacterium]